MTNEEKQAAYALRRKVITRPVRHIGGPVLERPLTVSYRADLEEGTRARLHAAGMEFAEEPEPQARGRFW